MSKKTVDVYKKCNADIHRLETYLTVIRGFLEGAANVCQSINNNPNLFPNWNESITTYIETALNLIYEMEARYVQKK